MKRGRLKPYNAKRRKVLYEKQFGEHAEKIRGMRCCVCGKPPPSHPHHVVSRGAGGEARHQVPLCYLCHNELHTKGRQWMESTYGVDLLEIAENLYEDEPNTDTEDWESV